MIGRKHQVTVTGVGVVTALGNSLDAYWNGLVRGASGTRQSTRIDEASPDDFLAAEVDLDQIRTREPKERFEVQQMALFVRFALAAARDAMKDARLDSLIQDGSGRGALFLGVAMGGLERIEAGVNVQNTRGARKTSPYLIPSLVPNMAASVLASELGLECPQYTICGGCASGSQAVGLAYREIKNGNLDWALAGGSESVLTPITYSGFRAMGILSKGGNGPSPRPFDRERDGMVIGEGAGLLVLESEEFAARRSVPSLSYVTGYATVSGCSKTFSQTHPTIRTCLASALEDAGINPGEVDCIYSHAGGLAGDTEELRAIAQLFEENRQAITSTKGHLGYTFGAAGPLDTIAAIQSIRQERIIGVLNFETPETPFSHLNIRQDSERLHVTNCLVNSFGMGGINAALVISKERSG